MVSGVRLSVEARSPAYITLSARPHRMGILVPEIPGFPWQAVFRGALMSQVRIWGGSGNFLLPLRPDTKDSEMFWALLELLDPDSWSVYCGSHQELEDLDAATYSTWRSRVDAELAKWPEDDRERLLNEAHAVTLVDEAIPSELEALLVARGSPLNHDGRIFPHGPVSATGAPPYPCVDVFDLAGLPEEVFEAELDDAPTHQLLAAAEFGALSPDARTALDTHGVRRRTERPSSGPELIRWLYDVNAQPGHGAFGLAEAGLGWYRPRPLVEDTVTVVAGEDAWDFAMAYAIRRSASRAFWVPASAFGSELEREIAYRNLVWFAERVGARLVVTSATDEAAGRSLAAILERHKRSAVIRMSTWRDALPARANRLLVRNRLGRPEATYLDDEATPHLRTPIPDVSDDAAKLRWMSDLHVRDWTPTRHRSLASKLVDVGGFGEARVTQQGLAYAGMSAMVTYGVPIEQLTVEPVLRPLPLLDQLRLVAAQSQWTCELSQKGQFALATATLFGGFAELGAALRDPDIGEVLRAYLNGAKTAVGLPLKDRRRYVSLEDFRALGLTRAPEAVLDDLRHRHVLHAGLVLKCPRCRHTDWYRPRDTDPSFACTRCATNHVPDRDAWLQDAEARWRYRLDEVVFQFARHRGDLPTLAAFERFEQSKQTVQFVPEAAITDPTGQEREIDFAVTEGSSLWLGEAFTDARYAPRKKTEMERLRRLADAAAVLNARGVIFATSADSVSAETEARAHTVFSGLWPELEFKARTWHLPRPTKLLDDLQAEP
jgi:hypothetical protein